MRTWLYVLGAIVIVVGVAAHFLWPHAPTITNYPSQGTDIIAFGDSLVAGTGATAGHGFVDDLSATIGQPIINLGVPGDTTAEGLARINDLDRYHPKVVLLLLGGNDFLRKVPQAQTQQNLAKLIEAIQARGAIVLLLGVRGGLLHDPFAPTYASLAKQYHTAYVSDVLSGLWGRQDLMADEVHPNDAGYAIIAQRIAPVLSPLLR